MITALSKRCVLVTGASGFIGRNLCAILRKSGYFVRGVVRSKASDLLEADEYVQVGDIDKSTDWQLPLTGVDIVIHLAARAHVFQKPAGDALEIFRKVNVLGTQRLAQMAAKAGVKRFIFISSVKVNGEGVQDNPGAAFRTITSKETPHAYAEDDLLDPQDAYGMSKREAEDALVKIAANTGLEIVILRPPLVYGAGVKANFKSLIKLVGSGLPLPFKNMSNRRSFIYLGNLVDAIILCISHPSAAGETFMVSDGVDLSTPELIQLIALAANKRAVLFSFPPEVLRGLCKIAGRIETWEKLTASLLVDSRKIRNLLGWKPPFTVEEGIAKTVKGLC